MIRWPLILAAALVLAPAAGASVKPGPLYQKLLTTPFPAPKGFYDVKVGTDTLDSRDKQAHAVGRVNVTLDSDAAIQYVVLDNGKDARWRFAQKPNPNTSDIKIKRLIDRGRAPGVANSKWFDLTLEGKNAFNQKVTNGASLMCSRVQITMVCSVTTSTDNDTSGDIPTTIHLLKSGIQHLRSVAKSTR